MLLTVNKNVAAGWREYLEDLLNSTDMPSGEEAGPRDPGMGSFISGAKVAKVVKN